MKLSKKELKNILKECLLEIFQDKDFSLKLESVISHKASSSGAVAPNDLIEKVNNVSSVVSEAQIQNPILKERVKILSNEFGGQNALFQKLLEDTALNTLQRQHEGHLGTGSSTLVDSSGFETSSEQAAAKQELKALSVDGDINRWAAVAFAKK